MFAASQSVMEFKAGKMTACRIGSSKKHGVQPDPRKGKLLLVRGDDASLKLQWKPRLRNVVEDDLLVFPENLTFTKVNTGVESDRVYLLQFKASSRRFFFWMQEADARQDQALCKKLNDHLSGITPTETTGDRNDLMQLLSNFGGDGRGGRPLQVGDLSSILQGMNLPTQPTDGETTEGKSEEKTEEKKDEEGEDESNQGHSEPALRSLTSSDLQRAFDGVSQSFQQTQPSPSLSTIVACSEIKELLQDSKIRDSLLEHLPSDQRSVQELNDVVSSPQLRQAFGVLSHALQSDEFNVVMANFGLDPNDGAEFLQRGDGIGAFLAALQAQTDKDKDEDFYN